MTKNLWVKLLIPIGIGAVAAFLHFQALAVPMPSASFTRVKTAISAGTAIDSDSLEEVSVSAPQEVLDKLKETAVPYADRKLLEGKPAQRDLKKNDIMFIRDAWAFGAGLTEPWAPVTLERVDVQPANLQVNCEVTFKVPKAGGSGAEFEQLGPFRVLAVGTRISQLTPGGKEETDRIIAVAVKYTDKGVLDDKDFDRLLSALAAAQANSQGKLAIAVNPNPPPRKPPVQPK